MSNIRSGVGQVNLPWSLFLSNSEPMSVPLQKKNINNKPDDGEGLSTTLGFNDIE